MAPHLPPRHKSHDHMTLKQQLVEAMEKSDVQEIKKEERTLAEIEDISAKLDLLRTLEHKNHPESKKDLKLDEIKRLLTILEIQELEAASEKHCHNSTSNEILLLQLREAIEAKECAEKEVTSTLEAFQAKDQELSKTKLELELKEKELEKEIAEKRKLQETLLNHLPLQSQPFKDVMAEVSVEDFVLFLGPRIEKIKKEEESKKEESKKANGSPNGSEN